MGVRLKDEVAAVTQHGRVPVFQTGWRGFEAHPLHSKTSPQ